MTPGIQLAKQTNSSIFLLGGRFGLISAVAGSIVFALIDSVITLINTYVILHIDTGESIFFYPLVLVIIILLSSALTAIPSFLLGGILAHLINRDMAKKVLSERNILAKGALFGAVAVWTVCLPFFLIEILLILPTGHGDLTVMVYHIVEATIVASLSGSWAGRQLFRRFISQEAA